MDARGVIGVAERTGYINRIRDLAKGCGSLWLRSKINFMGEFILELYSEEIPLNYKLNARNQLKEKLKIF